MPINFMSVTRDDALMGQRSEANLYDLDARLSLAYIQTIASLDKDIGDLRRALPEALDSPANDSEELRDLERLFEFCAAGVAMARDARDRVHRELLLLYRELRGVAEVIQEQSRVVRDRSESRRGDTSAAAPDDTTAKIEEALRGLADGIAIRPDGIDW